MGCYSKYFFYKKIKMAQNKLIKFFSWQGDKVYQWIDLVRITAQLSQRITHSCKIYNCWDSSEVLESKLKPIISTRHIETVRFPVNVSVQNLEQNSCWFERYLSQLRRCVLPVNDFLDIILGNLEAIAVTDSWLQKNTDRVGQLIWYTMGKKVRQSDNNTDKF